MKSPSIQNLKSKIQNSPWTWTHRLTAALFLLILILGRFDWFPWLKGSTAATRLFGLLRLADPLAGLEATLATRHLHEPLLLAGGILLVLYVLLGRVFCGWLCPLGLLLDLNDEVRERVQRWLRRRGRRLPDLRFPPRSQYWLLGLAVGPSLVAQLPAFQLVSPINVLARALIFAPGPELLLVGGILALEYLSRRGWCRSLCPLGAFYSLVGRLGIVRVLVDRQRPKPQCRLCMRRCPMGIRVMEEHVLAGHTAVTDPECTRCGVCVDACRSGVLRLGVVMPSSPILPPAHNL